MMNSPTPIAVFVYNRPNYTLSVLKSLEKCHRLDECRVVIFSDGPKKEADVDAVKATRKVAEAWAQAHKAEVVKRPENLGLARSTIFGMRELCEQSGRAISVEDDYLLNPFYLDYMLQALDRYQDEEQVAEVASYLYPVRVPVDRDAFLLPIFNPRGWATWQRVWSKVNWEPVEAVERLQDAALSKRFDIDGGYPYSQILFDRFNKKNDSYSVLFWWYIFSNNKLVVFPRQSLIWVGGFDGSGVHCGEKLLAQTSLRKVNNFKFHGKIRFPEKIEPDELMIARVKQFLIAKRNPPTLVERIRLKIYRTLTGDNRPVAV
jgi:hypothetical protein